MTDLQEFRPEAPVSESPAVAVMSPHLPGADASSPHASVSAASRSKSSTAVPRAPDIADPGRLADVSPDIMTLHTREAWQLFMGRRADPARRSAPIPGGRRFAAAMKVLWLLSANDNPYADWILQRSYERLSSVRARLDRAIAIREAEIQGLVAAGLSLSVMASSEPMRVEVGFRSPYGYAAAETILAFDRYVRFVRTLVHKDRLGENEGRAAIREIGRDLRSLFLEPIRWERHLVSDPLRALSRRDYLPGADAAARDRVHVVVDLFGEVPREIFTGAVQPRHTRRRIKVSDAERRLLQHVDLRAPDHTESRGGAA